MRIRIVSAEPSEVESTRGVEIMAGETKVGFDGVGSDLICTAEAIRRVVVTGANVL